MNSSRILQLILSVTLVMAGNALSLQAQQPAQTFEQLRSTLTQGQSVEVTDSGGTRYKGKIDSFSGSTISLTGKGPRRDFSETQVREIRRRLPDKWWNGMLIGAGVGVAATVVGVNGVCSPNDSECSTIATLVFLPIFVGGGAGVGAAIDFGIKKHETIFAHATSGITGAQISPILGSQTKGVRVAFRF